MPARILIVEDERITAEDLRDILTDLGYDVTGSVASGAEAIAQAEQNPPDLALMDIRIKGDIDGTETARVLRDRFNIPVVFLTAHADATTLSRAKLSQPLGYITKPFQEAELYAGIEIALHKHREDLKLRGQEELLASTVRAIAEGVIAVDKPESVTLFNPAAEAWTGWNAREALGKPIREIFPLVDSVTGEELNTPLWRVLSEGTVEEVGQGALLVDRGGAKRAITGSIAPTRDHHGEVVGAVLVFGRAPGDAAGARRRLPDHADDGVVGLGDFKMVAASPSMKQVLKFARRVAESEVSTILLEGESGTGKDIFAQFIHHFGRRRDGPFIAINCAAIPETLLESELFGYEKGAFTDARAPKAGILEVASGGTIFLDEVGEMPLLVQAKMLRVLEEQTFRRLGGVRDIQVDVRVVAATNRKLTDAIEQGKFRLDLYYRLNVIQVLLPPLRDRREDILPLAESFIKHYNSKFKRKMEGLSHGAAAILMGYDWPGNVRELRNVIERAMVLEESDWIQTSSLQILSEKSDLPLAKAATLGADDRFEVSLEEAEKSLLVKALEKAEGNQTRAAVLLGITRDTLRYKIKKFNLR
jgi:PAS domain S-box-containing protein